jgi:ubiquinone/menaquinone biosynthesis C-methylase UbiE
MALDRGSLASASTDLAGVDTSCRVLDIATGPGWVARATSERGARVVVADVSQAMLDGARKRLPHVEFVLSPAENLDLPDGGFDAVVSAFGLPHFANHGAFASEAARVLRPGGKLAFASWYPPAKNPFFAVAVGAISKYGSLAVELPAGVDMFHWAEQRGLR